MENKEKIEDMPCKILATEEEIKEITAKLKTGEIPYFFEKRNIDNHDSVVLSKEEYENNLTLYMGYKIGSKETAEKIFQRLFEEHNAFSDTDIVVIWQVKEVLSKIAEECGVEIKQ